MVFVTPIILLCLSEPCPCTTAAIHRRDTTQTSAGFQVANVIHRLRGGQKCSSGNGCSPQSPSSLGHLGSAAPPMVCAGTTLADMPLPTAPPAFRSPSECMTPPFDSIDLRALMAGIDTVSKPQANNKAESIKHDNGAPKKLTLDDSVAPRPV
jgi:hypothetical protein